MCEGIETELAGIDLEDKRLNRRSKNILEAMAANPQASINAACDGWSDTLATYRFFNNSSITPEQILQPHVAATERRIHEHPVVLIVQDTTELDFTSHPPGDAKCLNKEDRFGLYDHTHLAVTPDRLCDCMARVRTKTRYLCINNRCPVAANLRPFTLRGASLPFGTLGPDLGLRRLGA